MDCEEDGYCACVAEYDPVCVEIEYANGETEIIPFLNKCFAECVGFDEADFVDCEYYNDCNCTDEYDPVCVEIEYTNGETVIITFPNACEAECEGFDTTDFVDCEDNNEECDNDSVAAIIVECPWEVNYYNHDYTYTFNTDEALVILNGDTTVSIAATWSVVTGNTGFPTVIINANSGNFNDEWAFYDCYFEDLEIESLNDQDGEIEIDCD